MACRAFDIDVRQELHVERNRSRAVARRATQLASVIGECPRFQTDGPRSICFCEHASKIVMDAAICSDGGTYVRADRRGIDKMRLGHTVRLEEPHLRRLRRPVDPRLQSGHQHLQYHRRLAGTGYPCYGGQPSTGNIYR